MNNPVLTCRDLCHIYQEKSEHLQILNNVNLNIANGETIAIVGASGSGKSTLLQLLAGLSTPTSGDIFLLNKNLKTLSDTKKNELRNKHLGFVYQFHHLLPEFTALENIAMPLLIGNKLTLTEITQLAKETLALVGLQAKEYNKPAELSGGERQRVAIARAIINTPSIVFMDEPTGNLDPSTAEQIQKIILSLSGHMQTSFVVVTHDAQLAKNMDKQYQLQNNTLVDKSSK